MGRASHRDIFLFSHPRTLSNLLCRLLSHQPGWSQSAYHFDDPSEFAIKSFGWGPLSEAAPEQRQEFTRLVQASIDKLQEIRETATREGRKLFVKNHTYQIWEPSKPPEADGSATYPTKTNPTLLPDAFLASWRPVFLIRHPALVFESWYRAERCGGMFDFFDKSWSRLTSYQHTRELYDWYASMEGEHARDEDTEGFSTVEYSSSPIVMDADGILEKGCLEMFCDMCGMDRDLIRYEWEATKLPEEDSEARPRHLSFMKDFWSSTSIDKSKTSRGLVMASKYGLWEQEFGGAVADALYSLVEKAMPDYEYLKSRGFWEGNYQ